MILVSLALYNSFAFGANQVEIAPVGRVLSRLSRDVESLDNQLPNAMFQLLRMLASGKPALTPQIRLYSKLF